MRIGRVLIVLVGIIVVAFVPQVPQILSASLPKRGVVLDESTGEPIANAAVVASSYYAQPPTILTRGAEGLAHREIAWTDEHGRYRIPGNLKFITVGVPGLGLRLSTVIVAAKPGYIAPADRASLTFDENGMRIHEPYSISHPPAFDGFDFAGLIFGPIKLTQYAFSMKEKVAYYSALIYWTRSFDEKEAAEEKLRASLSSYISEDVCKMPPETRLDFSTATGVLDFARNRLPAIARARQLEPEFFGRDVTRRPTMSAEHLCTAFGEP